MKSITLTFLAALVAVACADGQYYVPRAYYVIDAEGHVSPPVPLRRLRRSYNPYPDPAPSASANAEANANANSWSGGDAIARAVANANADGGYNRRAALPVPAYWAPPQGGYGASNPNLKQ